MARQVWNANVSRSEMLVHPSKAYAGVWLRDSFWTLTALGDVRLSAQALNHFANRQNHLGQVPTQFTAFLRHPLYRPDESTLLFLIWSAWQIQNGGPRPNGRILERALNYIVSQAPAGLYRSRAGAYASWFDSYRLRQSDTLAFNQGLYAVALRAAAALHLTVPSRAIAAAEACYRALADPSAGYLRFSMRLKYHDVSGLAGEFLSLWLFGRPILTDDVVRRTLDSQPSFRGGFRVVVDGTGHYLSPHAFTFHVFAGDYQNGGSWLLYDYLALAVGRLHGVEGMTGRMHARLLAEFGAGPTFHEYLNTDPHSPLYGREPAYRDGFSWNTFVTRIDSVLQRRCGWA